jgi:hypothetical protein
MEERKLEHANNQVEFHALAKKITTNWIASSTGHGLPNIIRANNHFLRFIWICCYFTSATYCSYSVIKLCMDYARYDTVISMKEIRETPTDFPQGLFFLIVTYLNLSRNSDFYLRQVTFCNLNPYNEQVFYEVFWSEQSVEDCWFNLFDQNSWLACYSDITQSQQVFFMNFIDAFIKDMANWFPQDLLSYFGFDLKADLFMSCAFNGVECYPENFTSFWHDKYGMCYTFNNMRDIVKTSQAGINSGLQLSLIVRKLKGKFT